MPSAFRLPPSAFRLPPSAFRLPPSAFRLSWLRGASVSALAAAAVPASAACPSSYSAADCRNDYGHLICELAATTYTCTPAVAGATTATEVYAVVNPYDNTLDVFGRDSDGVEFCCPEDAPSVANLAIFGGDGDDFIQDFYATSTLCGTSGQGLNAELYGGAGDDYIYGADTYLAACTTLFEVIHGGAGDDQLASGGRAVEIYGDAGDDDLQDEGNWHGSRTGDYPTTMYGGAGNDTISTDNPSGNSLFGQDGNDVMSGYDGPDEMHGGNNNDSIAGGGGADMLWGDANADTLAGGSGADILYGGEHADNLCGGDGAGDELYGGNGSDWLYDADFDITVGQGGTFDSDHCYSGSNHQSSCEQVESFGQPCGSL